jgi:sulfate adenylyltransferase subunit 1 (EFTu-like GTPase family)
MQQREFEMSLEEYLLLLPRLEIQSITNVPLSLAHSDDVHLKTDKATLTKASKKLF